MQKEFKMVVGIPSSDVDAYLNLLDECGYVDYDVHTEHDNKIYMYYPELVKCTKRETFKSMLPTYILSSYDFTCTIVATPIEVCQNGIECDDPLCVYVDELYKAFDTPFLEEGFSNIDIVYLKDRYKTLYGTWKQWEDEVVNSDIEFRIAKALVNCGKPYVQVSNQFGVYSYPNFGNVSSYNVFFFDVQGLDKLAISQQIHDWCSGVYIKKGGIRLE